MMEETVVQLNNDHEIAKGQYSIQINVLEGEFESKRLALHQQITQLQHALDISEKKSQLVSLSQFPDIKCRILYIDYPAAQLLTRITIYNYLMTIPDNLHVEDKYTHICENLLSHIDENELIEIKSKLCELLSQDSTDLNDLFNILLPLLLQPYDECIVFMEFSGFDLNDLSYTREFKYKPLSKGSKQNLCYILTELVMQQNSNWNLDRKIIESRIAEYLLSQELNIISQFFQLIVCFLLDCEALLLVSILICL